MHRGKGDFSQAALEFGTGNDNEGCSISDPALRKVQDHPPPWRDPRDLRQSAA
jgi:hypothetical protein